MIVCVCANKREAEIIELIKDGATLDDLKKELGVCCNCCCCEETIMLMMRTYAKAKSD